MAFRRLLKFIRFSFFFKTNSIINRIEFCLVIVQNILFLSLSLMPLFMTLLSSYILKDFLTEPLFWVQTKNTFYFEVI